MITTAIDDIPGKMAALEASLTAALATRHIFRGCEPYQVRSTEQLGDGVINLILDQEHDYARGLGRVAQEGTLDAMLVGYIAVNEQTADRGDLQDAEIALAEEIKGWTKATGIKAFDVQLDSVRFSRQLEYPYGWLIASLRVGPPRTNTY